MSLPTTRSALVGTANGNTVLAHEVPIPTLTGDEVLIRTEAIALNPVDAKMAGPYITEGSIAGVDIAGEILAIGPDVDSSDFNVGHRVIAGVFGMNPKRSASGAFATYVVASVALVVHIPDSMSYDVAASIPTPFMSTGLALFYSLKFPYPETPYKSANPIVVLVSGGMTSCGTAATQLIRWAGMIPIVTCSPNHFEQVKAYGAEEAFDYNDPECAAKIKKYTKNNLKFALDCATTTESMKLCYASIGRAGGRYTALDPFSATVAASRKVVKADWVMAISLFGEEVGWPEPHYRALDLDVKNFGTEWRIKLQDLLRDGSMSPHPIDTQFRGLEGALEGMDQLRKGLVRGKKLVCPIEH
ncbi:hypothetical protein N7493_009292 [Penicillium malachiteum]|uniref:Enoyl reductase (ER) domain-containing protein n=1 Tax=Penicillium malachiteum TaxID=1324776 RepID=A0AAD6HGQ2_9EURO|nr:hypothetical protein N7493_009292 [Penicillium malachiteum]